ncbi:MAG TPA: hypothetical protein VNF07_01085 [Acidimicrobiales bacterium]|nr:hypothetical protein [Acidimicrobiales bacterium]
MRFLTRPASLLAGTLFELAVAIYVVASIATALGNLGPVTIPVTPTTTTIAGTQRPADDARRGHRPGDRAQADRAPRR